MSIVAALDKVLFFNASSKYSVLRMKTEDSSVPTEARSPYRYHDHLIRFTAVGIELPQTDTVKIEMDGEWKDGKYGLQLQVDHWQEIVPPTLEGVRNYLASGLLKGIGEKTADAIIEKFGVNALEILEHQPDRLLEIRGITKERLAEIKDAYDTVIIPLLAAHNVLLTRNLLYTAITRAKRRVLLVGEKRALYMAIHRSRKGKRNTMLGERIALYYKAVTRKALRNEEGEEWQRAS